MELNQVDNEQQLKEWLDEEGLEVKTISEASKEAEKIDFETFMDNLIREMEKGEEEGEAALGELMEVVIEEPTPPPPPKVVEDHRPWMNRNLLQAMVVEGRKHFVLAAAHPEAVGVLHPTGCRMAFVPISILPEVFKMNAKGAPIEQDAVWCWADYDWLKGVKEKCLEASQKMEHHWSLPVFCPPEDEDYETETAVIATTTWDDDCGPWTNLGETPGPWSTNHALGLW